MSIIIVLGSRYVFSVFSKKKKRNKQEKNFQLVTLFGDRFSDRCVGLYKSNTSFAMLFNRLGFRYGLGHRLGYRLG